MFRLKGFAAAGRHILAAKPASIRRRATGRIIACAMLAIAPVATYKIVSSCSSLSACVFSSGDAARPVVRASQTDSYRRIFALQSAGRMDEADRLIAGLTDRALLGHVLAQRYLHPGTHASFSELKAWLALYGDHPENARIARLASLKAPEGTIWPASVIPVAQPIAVFEESGMTAKSYQPDIKRSAADNDAVAELIDAIRTHTRQSEPSAALRLFNESPASARLDDVEKDRIRAMIAAGYLYAGKTAEARRLSGQAVGGSKDKAPVAGWISGLSEWQAANFGKAAASFESAAKSDYASGWLKSAASYWAARSHEKGGHKRRMRHWLEEAASYPRTFYGLLALQSLGRAADIDWRAPDLSDAQERAITATPAGSRAEKLLAAGQLALAEAELRSLYDHGDPDRKRALLAYAYDRKLPSLAMKLAHTLSRDRADSALYPAMPWQPDSGYRIDRALIHAIVRQESHFNAAAENSASGATGLMQLMPNTAFHVAGKDIFRDEAGRALLKTPQVSLDIGQEYVEELLNSPQVGQDLLSLAVAYNAGPGKLARWKAERANMTDPLLFIETLPYAETRSYVTRVLANYWIYRMRFDQPNESMQALAKGHWARYAAYDKDAVRFAEIR